MNSWQITEANLRIMQVYATTHYEHQKHSNPNTCRTRILTPFNMFWAWYSTFEANLLNIYSVEALSLLRLCLC